MALKPAQIISNIRANYNTIAKDWDASRFRPNKVKLLLLKTAKPDMIVGDIGCGNGLILPELLKRKIKKYYGLDISKNLIAISKKKYASEIKKGKAEFVVGNALKLPYVKNKFDLIFSLAVMHHLPGKKNHLKFLQEIKRVLKPGGKAIIFNWNLLSPATYERFHIKESLEQAQLKGNEERDLYVGWKATPGQNIRRFIHIFLPDEMAALAGEVGFSQATIQYYGRLGKKEINGEELVTILKK